MCSLALCNSGSGAGVPTPLCDYLILTYNYGYRNHRTENIIEMFVKEYIVHNIFFFSKVKVSKFENQLLIRILNFFLSRSVNFLRICRQRNHWKCNVDRFGVKKFSEYSCCDRFHLERLSINKYNILFITDYTIYKQQKLNK